MIISYQNPIHRKLFKSFYYEVLNPLFDSDLLPDFDVWDLRFRERSDSLFCMLTLVGDKVVAGIVAEYMENSQCAVIEFLQALQASNCEILLEDMVVFMRNRYPKLKHIFIELTPTAKFLHNGIYERWCKRVDLLYITPPVIRDKEPIIGMLLCVVDELTEKISGKDVTQFLSEYFVKSFVDGESFVPQLGKNLMVRSL